MEQTQQREPFTFSGSGGEYFRIWIVNLCLSIVTLGIYSAWAKVRRMQYFYRHTSVAGASFDYHGDPKAILKGRVIAMVLFGLYSLAGKFSLVAGVAAFALIMVVMPWLLVRSFRFRLHNTSYRGLRFAFHGKVGDGYINFLLMPLAGYVSLGLLWPLAHQQIKRYLHNNSTYGDAWFAFHAKASTFYRPYLVVFAGTIIALVVGFLAAVMLTWGTALGQKDMVPMVAGIVILVYLAALLFIAPYISARLQNITWNATTLGPHAFESDVRAIGLFRIMMGNFLLIIFTLGLFKPFADIRLARYRIEHMALLAGAGLEELVAGEQITASAAGEETADMFDMDIAI